VSEETFGGRLRRERERRDIALSSISANSKISVSYFEALERDDLSRWPAGIFRRAFIRAYAAGIGLDPDAIAREFSERFPDPAEPPPVPPGEAPATAHPARAGAPPSDPVLRLTLADTAAPFVRGALLAEMRSRCVAVACDAGVTLAVAISMYVVSGLFWLPFERSAPSQRDITRARARRRASRWTTRSSASTRQSVFLVKLTPCP
jgi:transcriptional regulator with XRE-family HTH domain